MRTIFINPINQTISHLRIPGNPTRQFLLQIVGGSTLHSAWINYVNRIFYSERDEPPDPEEPCFWLPGSPRLYSRAIILDSESADDFRDVTLSIGEAVKLVRWEGGRPGKPSRKAKDATRRRDKVSPRLLCL